MNFGGVVRISQRVMERESFLMQKECLKVRDMFIVMLEWYIGMKTDFTVNTGKFGKHFEQYIEEDMWEQFKRTFSNAEYENIWDSFFVMGDLFREVANEIANTYEYQYPQDDDDKVTNYLKHVKALPKDSTSIY